MQNKKRKKEDILPLYKQIATADSRQTPETVETSSDIITKRKKNRRKKTEREI